MIHLQYIKKVLLFLAIFAVPIGSNGLFLFNSGELLSDKDIADKQLASEKNCIVGLATRNSGYYYKQEMYRKIKPEILILGSSRVMQYRKEFFSRSMLNAGGAMNSINEGFSFVTDSFNEVAPKVLIMGLDYWWFSANYKATSQRIT